MPQNALLRDSPGIWRLRISQLILNLIAVLGVGLSAGTWHSLDCGLPSNVTLGIAVASICLPCLIYLIPATGGSRQCLRLPWNQWLQLVLDGIFLLLWIIAAADGSYKCDNVCSVCSAGGASLDDGAGFSVSIGSAICNCVFESDFDYRRSISSALVRRDDGPTGVPTWQTIFRIVSQVVIIIEFLVTFCLDIYYIVQYRKQYHRLPDNNGIPMQMPPQGPPEGPPPKDSNVSASVYMPQQPTTPQPDYGYHYPPPPDPQPRYESTAYGYNDFNGPQPPPIYGEYNGPPQPPPSGYEPNQRYYGA